MRTGGGGLKKRILSAALSLLLLSGCSAREQSSAQSAVQSAVTSCEPADITQTAQAATEENEPAPTYEAARTSGETAREVTEDCAAASAEMTRQEPEVTAEAESTTGSMQASENAAPEETPVQTTVQTTAQTTADEPVSVVIPEVRVPLSPGKETAGSDKALLDYSNSSEGYISVCWNETGKRVKLRIIGGGSTYDHDVPTGGVTEYYPLSCGSGDYTVQIYEQTEGDRYTKVLEQELTAVIGNETSPFTYPNRYVWFDRNSECVEKAAQLCAGKSGTIEKTAAVFGWITENVTYDRELAATVKSGYVPDPDSVLKKRSGICYDYASLMAAMLRSQDIPVRLVVGYAKDNIYHAWNEIWTEQTGWITPELLLSKHGYNITDATFYAGSADKEKIAGYISDSGNYSALYYY